VITAKIMNLFLKDKINPLIGSARIASVPIAARVSHIVANQANPHNHLIFHAMGPNLAGVFGTAISVRDHAGAAWCSIDSRSAIFILAPSAVVPARRPEPSAKKSKGGCPKATLSRQTFTSL
jgi:hypothetical protein